MSISSGRSAIRLTAVMLALPALVAGAATVARPATAQATATAQVTTTVRVTATAQAAATVQAAAAGAEDNGAGCAVSLPGSLTANSLLPDPFTRLDGTRISSVSDWTCRREEILQLAEKYIYGPKPPKPA